MVQAAVGVCIRIGVLNRGKCCKVHAEVALDSLARGRNEGAVTTYGQEC